MYVHVCAWLPRKSVIGSRVSGICHQPETLGIYSYLYHDSPPFVLEDTDNPICGRAACRLSQMATWPSG